MPGVKRSSSEVLDEIEVKSETKRSKTENGSGGSSPKKTPVKWSAAEDAIFAEITERILKAHMWEEVKADGRLAHRKANGIYMRIGVMVKKMTK